MRGGARTVLGIDISAEACAHAAQRYNIPTKQGDATHIPVEDAAVDAVVSFETIEHVDRPEAFLDECRRVIRPGGTLIISTPNRDLFRETHPSNEFHCSELTTDEFVKIFEARFKNAKYYWQRPQKSSVFDLRGVIDERWALRKIRGVGRISLILQHIFRPQLRRAQSEKWANDPVGAIVFEPSQIGKRFDRYSIFPGSVEDARHALFTVAVGQV